jgi:manganese transport protein
LNMKLIADQLSNWFGSAGNNAWVLEILVIPILVLLGVLLLYITLHPWLRDRISFIRLQRPVGVHQDVVISAPSLAKPGPYKHVAVALDFSGNEEKLLAESLRFIDKSQTQVTLMHVVESPVARSFGTEGEDLETFADQGRLERLVDMLKETGIETGWRMGAGEPSSELAKMINTINADIVVLGSHGHTGVSDLIHGTVISNLRHRVKASVMIVPLGAGD